MLRFPAQILPMMGFSSCNDSDVFQWPKLVSIGGSYSEPFSRLHWCTWCGLGEAEDSTPHGHSNGAQNTLGDRYGMRVVDREKLRAVLLINPTKSTLLLILNRGEVGPKKPRQTSCIWFNRQLILLQSSPNKLPTSHLALNPLNQNSLKKTQTLASKKTI